jgi:hypothetical protein
MSVSRNIKFASSIAIITLSMPQSTLAQTQQGKDNLQAESLDDIPEANYPPLTESEAKRYTKIASNLVKYILENNKDEYRKLFTDEGWDASIPWWHEMFATQRKIFGPIAKAYAPTRELVMASGLGVQGPFADGAAFIIQFEDSAGGLLSIKLDENDKITATDVFVTDALGSFKGEPETVIFDAYAPPETMHDNPEQDKPEK